MNLSIISNYLHILAMSVWVGGMFYIMLVEVPVLRSNLGASEFSKNMTLLGKRFQKVGWVLLIILLMTGLSNIMLEDSIADMMKNENYLKSIVVKLILFTLMVINTAIHTFYLGPKMSTLAEKSSTENNDDLSAEYDKLKKRSIISSAFSLLLSLVIIYYGLIASRV